MAGACKAHVLAVPFPAQGHINPLMRLCKTLSSHGILITFVNTDSIHRRILDSASTPKPASADSPQTHIRIAHLPFAGVDMANDFKISIQAMITRLEELGGELLRLTEVMSSEQSVPPITCIISDVLMSTATQELADTLKVPRFALFTWNQGFTLFLYYLVQGAIPLQAALNARFENKADKFHDALPGLPALNNADVPYFKHVQDNTDCVYAFAVKQSAICFTKADMILANSFDELESPAFHAMSSKGVPVYSVGPLMEDLSDQARPSLWTEQDDCLDWLDKQPIGSVLYMSFGSMAMVSNPQFQEIILGVAASNHKFLLTMRPDMVQGVPSPLSKEFLNETKDRGYVVSWCPQLRVLSHAAVGGFLTHCGWNSVMEGLAKGVPMLCWPYDADQMMVAKYVVEEWKVGMRFDKAGGVQVLGRGEVERVVRALMEAEEGKMCKANVSKLSQAGLRSLQTGGSSLTNLLCLVRRILTLPSYPYQP